MLPLAVALVGVLANAGCNRNIGTLELYFLTGEGEDPFALVDLINVRVGVDGESPRIENVDLLEGEEVTIPEILVGDGWTVSVVGETRGGVVISRGRSLPFKIQEGENRLDLYIATTDGFSTAAAASIPGTDRGGHTAVELVDGRVALIGGGEVFNVPIQGPVRQVDIFDPTSGRIVEGGACGDSPPQLCLISERVGAAIGRTSNGDILVVGGKNGDSWITSIERLPRGERSFVVSEKSLTRLDSSIVQTSFGALLLGGLNSDGDREDSYETSGILFDHQGNYEDEYEGILARGRKGAAIVVLPEPQEQVFVFSGSGYEEGSQLLRPDYEIVPLSPLAQSSKVIDFDPSITPRVNAVATVIDERFVLLTGGLDETGMESSEVDLFFVSDEGHGILCNVGSMEYARRFHAAAPLFDGNVIVVGGQGSSSTAEIIDPHSAMSMIRQGSCDTITSEEIDLPGDSRILSAATALANDTVLISGGFREDGSPTQSHLLWVQ